jgi:hypothetical protein
MAPGFAWTASAFGAPAFFVKYFEGSASNFVRHAAEQK